MAQRERAAHIVNVVLSSVAVLVAALIGASVPGALGAVMAIPVAGTITVFMVSEEEEEERAATSARAEEPAETAPNGVPGGQADPGKPRQTR